MKRRFGKRMLVIIALFMLAAAGYFFIINRNSKDMTGRQKVMKAMYPLLTGVTRLFGKNSDVLMNSERKKPSVPVYDMPVTLNSGNQFDLHELAGRKILFVNTASDCGYTAQYEDLQKLQNRFAGKVQVIGFPANDFSEQEKGTDNEIMKFCKLNYGITFPLSTKSVVIKSAQQNEVFRWLTDKNMNGWNDKAPTWNFSKFLVDEKGNLTHYFDPSVSPLGDVITDAINEPG